MMNDSLEYLDIVEFLLGKGYSKAGAFLFLSDGTRVVCTDLQDALTIGLAHFLSRELGRKWREMFNALEDVGRVFSQDEFESISQAIRFYDTLNNA